jgi:hypothetical protein
MSEQIERLKPERPGRDKTGIWGCSGERPWPPHYPAPPALAQEKQRNQNWLRLIITGQLRAGRLKPCLWDSRKPHPPSQGPAWVFEPSTVVDRDLAMNPTELLQVHGLLIQVVTLVTGQRALL